MNYSEAALQQVREDRLLIHEVDRWLYEEITPYIGQRVLEIGCGVGNFSRHFVDRDLYVGIEPSAESINVVRQKFADFPNMQAFVYDATSPGFSHQFSGFRLDTIFSLNVFEHIEDHMAALRNGAAVLQSGGKFILIVPAHQWLYGGIDRAIGHYRRYSKRLVADMFSQVGLTCVAQRYINALGALGWFVNARFRTVETPPQSQLRLFNRITPWLKRAERIAPPPFGISVMTVGIKE